MKKLLIGLLSLASISAFADKGPCGLTGSVNERIKDCSQQESSTKGSFVLVTRTKGFKEIREIHKDNKSGLLWGDRLHWKDQEGKELSSTMHQWAAVDACKGDIPEIAWLSNINLTWRLPTKEEFEQAKTDGIFRALPNMEYHSYWSSSLSDYSLYIGKAYWEFHDDGRGGEIGFAEGDEYKSVRCVAQENIIK